MGRRAHRRAVAGLAVAAAVIAPLAAQPLTGHTAPQAAAAHSFVTVMTRNMDEGTDFGYITAAAGHPELLGGAIVTTFCEVVASNVEQRAARIADEIAASQPDIVSLQEVAEWQSFVDLPCTGPTQIDAEGALLDRLAADSAAYTVVGQLDEFNSSSTLGLPVSFLDRDVMLARVEPAVQLTLSNFQANHFSTLLTIPLAPGLDVTIERGWLSVDATVRGNTARIISTHLESFFELVQEAQAVELATGPGATALPVIIAGDLNTGPGSAQTASYDLLTGVFGYTDTWAATHPTTDPGYTDSFYTEDPFTIVPGGPTERIDLVLVHGAAVPSAPKDYQVGTEVPHPSDHAGVVAKVTIPS